MEKNFVTIKEAARVLETSEWTVRKMIQQGVFKYIWLGGRINLLREGVNDYKNKLLSQLLS